MMSLRYGCAISGHMMESSVLVTANDRTKSGSRKKIWRGWR
jgi:hypothetical protein